MTRRAGAMRAASASEPAALLSARWYRHYVLGILFLGYFINAMHRNPLLGLSLEEIRAEFGVSDTLLGLLSGMSFAFFYAVMGIFIAAWADRTSRRMVLSLAVAFWSAMTALFGMATNFALLLLARVGVATGQAGNSPPAHSLISDYFPKSERARAFSIFALGVPFGSALGNLLGGYAVDGFGWRMAFVLFAVPGLLVALIIRLTVKEPPRGFIDGVAPAAVRSQAPSLPAALTKLWERRAFRHLTLAVALLSAAWYARSAFNAAFLIRSHGLSASEAGTWLMAIALISGAGTFLGGYVADRMSTRTNDRRWYFWVPGIATLIAVVFQFGAYLSDDRMVAFVSLSLMMFAAGTFFGPAFAMTQALAPLRMRSVATSVLLFIQTMIGLGLGPLVTGQISDVLMPALGDESLRYALAIIGLAGVWSAAHYYLGSRHLRAELAQAEAEAEHGSRDGP